MSQAARGALAGILRLGRLLWAVLARFDRDKGLFLASALAFSILLSTIPLCLLLLSVLGTWLSNDAAVAEHLGERLRTLVPALDQRIVDNLLDLIRHRRIFGVAGVAGLAWTSTMVFGALRTSLNAIFGVARGRSTLRALGVDLLMILLCGSLLVASMLLTSWISVLERFGARFLPQVGPLASLFFKYALPLFFTALMCFMVYFIAPNRRVRAVPCLKAALFTGLLWEGAKHLFGWYVLHLGRHSLIYGPLSAAAIFVLWIYYSSAIFLLGAAVAAALEAPPEGAGPAPGGGGRTLPA